MIDATCNQKNMTNFYEGWPTEFWADFLDD
jgi:hypothetical protein